MKRTLIATAAALLLAPALAFAGGDDQQFATAASQGNQLQVALGRLAADKAQDTQVRNFARRMVDDHSKAQKQLQEAAKKEGITLSGSLTEAHRSARERLAEKSGEAFDRAYVKAMVADHDKALAAYEKNGEAADTAVENYAAAFRPIIRKHDQMAKELEKQEVY